MEESGPAGPVEPEAKQTPTPPSPPSSSTAPPAPATFKQPLPKHISSPTPFSTISSSSPTSKTLIPPPIFENPPASSSAGSSSAGPSSAGPSVPPPSTSYSTLHPPTPPSFITLILEGARIPCVVIEDIKDEFEEAILHSVLSLSSHVHRTDPSSPAPKKRKVSKDLTLSFEPHFFKKFKKTHLKEEREENRKREEEGSSVGGDGWRRASSELRRQQRRGRGPPALGLGRGSSRDSRSLLKEGSTESALVGPDSPGVEMAPFSVEAARSKWSRCGSAGVELSRAESGRLHLIPIDPPPIPPSPVGKNLYQVDVETPQRTFYLQVEEINL
ncbi:hypothetical protein Taro_016298 [Colocasia esculenta]|uniref:Uncharacterized protein n=1 Tax=Colocasia esculenta TaxID=4460 RepID=A0A843UJZ6_COLES|nr:hypothetical protein [Colocasia esculenta]